MCHKVRVWLCFGYLVLAWMSRAEDVIFHLRNGDRITGAITSENGQEVTITSALAGKITLPLAQIVRREKPAAATTAAEAKPVHPTPPAGKTASESKVGDTNKTTLAKAPDPTKP